MHRAFATFGHLPGHRISASIFWFLRYIRRRPAQHKARRCRAHRLDYRVIVYLSVRARDNEFATQLGRFLNCQ
jgi:hypothetical protein